MLWTLNFAVAQWTPLPALPAGDSLADKIVVLTGANSGIGLAARGPAKLVLACRNMSTGAEALAAILKAYPRIDAVVWELDLADFASIRAFGERAAKELPRVDSAVLNAGMNPGMSRAAKPRLTGNGHEVTHQVNVLGTILLALLLVPALRKAPSPHLVFTSSAVHAWGDAGYITATMRAGGSALAATDDAAHYYQPGRYYLSKLLLQMVMRHLVPALPDIVVVSANPGGCWTNLAQNMSAPTAAEVLDLLKHVPELPFFRSPARGAHLVLAGIWEEDSAEYYHNCKPTAPEAAFMATGLGIKATEQYYREVVELCERVATGSSAVLKQ